MDSAPFSPAGPLYLQASLRVLVSGQGWPPGPRPWVLCQHPGWGDSGHTTVGQAEVRLRQKRRVVVGHTPASQVMSANLPPSLTLLTFSEVSLVPTAASHLTAQTHGGGGGALSWSPTQPSGPEVAPGD